MRIAQPLVVVHAGIWLLLGGIWINLRHNITENRDVAREIQRQVEASGAWTKTEHERYATRLRADTEELLSRVRHLEATTRPSH